ncbi:MAG: hypothetical protein HY735_02995 [Verrucomicrobia bacterium]|nr:hypothetical protein [Verrucomicrobiota bacterium]
MKAEIQHGSIRRATPGLWSRNFREAYCAAFACQPEEYERSVFWKSLYRHALPVAAVLYRSSPGFFKEDFDLLRELGKLSDPALFKSELNFFYGRNVRDKNWFRRAFRIRVSAKRLIRLKEQVLQVGQSADLKTPGV